MLQIKIFMVCNIFLNLDDTLHSSAQQEMCMKATQTNMEESEHDTERGNSKQERDSYLKDGLFLTHGCGLGMKSLTQTSKTYSVPTTDSNTTNLFYQLCKNHVKKYKEKPLNLTLFYISHSFIQFIENVLYCDMYCYLDMK